MSEELIKNLEEQIEIQTAVIASLEKVIDAFRNEVRCKDRLIAKQDKLIDVIDHNRVTEKQAMLIPGNN